MFHVVYYSVPRISVVSVHSSSSQSVSQYQNYEDMVSLAFRSAKLAVVVDYSAPGMSIARVFSSSFQNSLENVSYVRSQLGILLLKLKGE